MRTNEARAAAVRRRERNALRRPGALCAALALSLAGALALVRSLRAGS